MSDQEPWERPSEEWDSYAWNRSGWPRGRHWRPGQGPPPWVTSGWHGRRGPFFRHMAGTLVAIMLLIAVSMAVLAFLFTHLFQGNGHIAFLVWIGGCGLSLLLPLLALGLGARAFRSFAVPLADIMDAADAVAGGNLDVRVQERGSRDFQRLAHSFNRMTTELARIDQQRRNLTADVAHELRTPLHIIQGNLEGVLDGVYTPTPEHIEATLEETRQLARLVEDLRTLSLAESGQLPLVREPIDVCDLLADLATSFSGMAEAGKVELRVENALLRPVVASGAQSETERVTVVGDAGRLDQVLSNLVINALHHTPPEGTIKLAAARQGDSVQIQVQDSGEGIPAEELPFIFDRFWKGDRSRSHQEGAGSGLGLSIAYQLVKAHGGQIHVSSTVGKGTTFAINLPAASESMTR